MVLKKKEIIAASLCDTYRVAGYLNWSVSRYNKGTGRRKLR